MCKSISKAQVIQRQARSCTNGSRQASHAQARSHQQEIENIFCLYNAVSRNGQGNFKLVPFCSGICMEGSANAHSENINLHRNRDRDEAAVFCKAWHNRQKGSDKKRYFKAVFHGVEAVADKSFHIGSPFTYSSMISSMSAGVISAFGYFLAAFFRSLTSTCHS